MDDNDIIIQELSEVIQSSNLNFLFGAGTSTPYLPLLGDIEKKLNQAKTVDEKETLYKEYLNKVMLPNKRVISKVILNLQDYKKTKTNYEKFFRRLTQILLKRKSTILSKQVNLFTTNIDILMERILEDLQIEYNDGFSGKFNPVFSLANFKKTFFQRSLHYEHISEIPVFNIIKIHGSLTWQKQRKSDRIIFSHSLKHIKDNLPKKTKDEFDKEYKKILVVNPEESKHLESVLNVYYSELLRLYSSELEKENASLFVVGFSMEDRHIREITLRAVKSNPTLRVFIFCSDRSKKSMENKMEIDLNSNIQIFSPGSPSVKFSLDYLSDNVLNKISFNNGLNHA